jgi:hypothetical protein
VTHSLFPRPSQRCNIEPVGGVALGHVITLAEHQQIEAARGEEKLVHGMEDVLPAEVPSPRMHRSIRASQLQLADVDSVRLSLVRVKGLVPKALGQRSLPGSAASNYEQLHLSQRPPLGSARWANPDANVGNFSAGKQPEE